MKRLLFPSLLFLLWLTSCSQDQQSADVNASYTAATTATPSSVGETSLPQTPIVVKRGRLTIESMRIDESKAEIDRLVEQSGAYYESESAENQRGQVSYNLMIRVPVNRFDSVITNLEHGTDRITSKNITVEDITGQYIDVKTRLENKRSYLNRYQEMVKTATSVKDILEIEEQVQKLQEDIETTEKVIQTLDEQVNYCSLSIYLFTQQNTLAQHSDSFLRRAGNAVINGWRLIEYIVLTVITLWPIWMIATTIIFVIYRLRVRRRRTQNSRPASKDRPSR